MRVKVWFNGEPDFIGAKVKPPPDDVLASFKPIKYYPYKQAIESMKGYDSIMEILSHMEPSGRYQHNIVDVKPQYLEKGSSPCTQFWHCDVVDNPLHDSVHERHTMYVANLNCPTKFLSGADIYIPDSGFAYDAETHRQCEASEQWFAPDSTVFRLNRMHIHCCQPAKESGWRIMVRLTETNNYRRKK
jgi:hypothetical protein